MCSLYIDGYRTRVRKIPFYSVHCRARVPVKSLSQAVKRMMEHEEKLSHR
jgi:hypothetical protein